MTVLVRIEPAVVLLCFRATVTALVLGVLVIVR